MKRRLLAAALGLSACAVAEVPEHAPPRDAAPLDASAVPPPLHRPGEDAAPVDAAPPDAARPPRFDAAAPPPDAARPPSKDAAPPPADGAPVKPPPVDAAPPAPDADRCAPETCNGLDDDCNGVADDPGVCGPWVQSHCTLWLGWADRESGPFGASPSWGPCPDAPAQAFSDLRCNSTRRDGLFRQVHTAGNVNDDDQLALAFTCDDAQDPALAAWVQAHCGVWLGWADDRRGFPEGSPAWLGCPTALQDRAGSVACTSTAFDGDFHSMLLGGDVDDNDQLGLAWVCRDPGDPARAGAMQSSVEVFLGWADDNAGPGDGSPSWAACPAQSFGDFGNVRCTGTRGDGAFHRLDLGGDVDENDAFGIALRSR